MTLRSDEHVELEPLNRTENNQNGSSRDSDDSDSEDTFIVEDGSRTLISPRWRDYSEGGYKIIWWKIKSIVIEAAPTLLLTTISLLFTGQLLDEVSHWRAMQQVDQLIIVIPVVLNLKGNIEMNLSARLGTAANVGELDDPTTRRTMILGNLALLQVQAAVVSFTAACVAFLLGFVIPRKPPPSTSQTAQSLLLREIFTRKPLPTIPLTETAKKFTWSGFAMVVSSSMTAAALSSLLLGSFMCGLIVLCRIFNRDPDNIAPPIASCLGDLVTLSLLGLVSTVLIGFIRTPITLIVCVLVIGTSIFCFAYTRRNDHVRPLLKEGWSPLFGAMIISCGTGIILDMFVSKYEDFAVLAVVISGLPGSVGAIFVSRLSTALHAAALSLPSAASSTGSLASKLLPQQASPSLVILTLLVITLPVEIIFLSILRGLGWLSLPSIFTGFSLIFFCVAVLISLYVAQFLTNYLWSRNLDPDTYALPVHSALMDLVGQLLLVFCFEIVSLLGVRVQTRPGEEA